MQTRNPFARTLFFLFLSACLLIGLVGTVRMPAQAAPHLIYPANSVVISEFRFRGSGGGTDEFVELYNPTGGIINLNGLKLRGSNSVASISDRYTFTTDVFLAPGQFYLLANIAVVDGITADATYGTGITSDGGVALTLSDNTIIDQVGLSLGSVFKEVTPLAELITDTDRSYERRIGGVNGNCQDDNNNAADFALLNPSNPQNFSSPLIPCGVPTATVPPAIEVIINEIAWAGTQAFAGDEWIELYNATVAGIDLTNWRLEAADGDPIISLSGLSIPANGYLLLERGSPNVTNVPTGGNVVTFTYFSGLLGDNGETLYLINDFSQVVDTANANGGTWPSGSNSLPRPSMERTGVAAETDSGWVTFAGLTFNAQDAAGNNIFGTPGSANWGSGRVPTPGPDYTGTAASILTGTAASNLTSTAAINLTGTAAVNQTSTGAANLTGTATMFTKTSSPTPVGFLSVVISEVGWMGTGNGPNDEWIELYNPSTTATINISGWVLRADDGSPNITFPTGSAIPPRGFFVLERTGDNTISDVTANLIYTGALSDSFDVLRLYPDASLTRVIDIANANSGNWPAGMGSPNLYSMERVFINGTPLTEAAVGDGAWVSNTNSSTWAKHDARGTASSTYLIRGTPGYANWAFSVTATPSPVPTATLRGTPTRTPVPPPPPPLIAINEFVPRPGSDWNNDGVVNISDEYIELLNHGVIDVNLSGYRLDDEANIGSNPFTLPSITLKPGERVVFYGSQTGLLLSDGGDGVRLLKPNGQLADAYNYSVVQFPDQSFCRLPDNGGADDWSENCFPTPGLRNSLSGSALRPPTETDEDRPLCPIADTLPEGFVLAECTPFGNNIWNRFYWDKFGWFGERSLPYVNGKWEVFAD